MARRSGKAAYPSPLHHIPNMYLFYTPDIETSHFLSEEESGHCVRVLRYDHGDEILLTDGRGTTYHARITNPHPRHCEFEILSKRSKRKRTISTCMLQLLLRRIWSD